jgi:hypothetical protein
VPGGVVADVVTISWPIAVSVLKSPGVSRMFDTNTVWVTWGMIQLALAPDGRPLTDMGTPPLQPRVFMVTA